MQVTLSKKQRQRFFIKEYYHGRRKIRIVFWVCMVCLGAFLMAINFNNHNESDRLLLDSVLILTSLGYLFFPWIWILFNRRQFNQDCQYELIIEPDKITVHSDEADETKIAFSSFSQILLRKEYVMLKLPNRTVIYIPVSQLNSKELEHFSKYINN